MITANQLVAHAVGDYLIQSDWMAAEKTKRWAPAIAHAVSYALPFVLLTRSLRALAIIAVTHAVIDHYRLARHVCWAKNWLSPEPPPPWDQCKATGYGPDKPPWMAVWLMIIADNTMHVLINGLAVRLFGNKR